MACVTEVLKDDHRAIERLFDQYDLTPDDDTAQRLGDALVLHACVEEAFLYPIVRGKLVGGDRLVEEAEDDHERVKQFVAEAEDTHGAALDELIAELRIDVEMHHRWEEEDLFPWLQDALDAGTLHELAQRVLAFKRSQPVA